MPYSQELGMRVYDPEEGAQIGAGIGDAFGRAMLAAQQRKLSEREIALQERQQLRLEDEAARQARYMVRRQRGLQNMAYDYQDLLKVGATPEVAHRMATIQNLPDLLEGASPQAIESVLNSDQAANIKELTNQFLRDKLERTLDLQERLGFGRIEAHKDIVKEQIQSKEGLAEKAGEQKQLDRESRERIADKKDTFESKIDTLSKLQIAADAAMNSGDEALYKETKAKLDAARALTPGGKAMGESAEPVVKDINGVKIAYVPGSKNIHIIPNEPSKKAFLSKSIPLLIRDGIKPEDAVDKLGKAFDLMNPGGTAAPAATPSPTVKVGTIVKQNGKRYRFDGAKYVEIP